MRFLAKVNTRKTTCQVSSGMNPSVFIPVPQPDESLETSLVYSSHLDVLKQCFVATVPCYYTSSPHSFRMAKGSNPKSFLLNNCIR